MKMKRHKVRVFGLILFAMATTLIFLPQIGICAKSSTIQKVTESESEFSKPPTMTGYEAPLTDQYRIYHRASTGFVSIESIRISAEKRATDFCKRQNQNMNVVSEQFSKPPYIFGRFPRIEIIFACSTDISYSKDQSEEAFSDFQDTLYIRLQNLQKLLNEGVISQEEFDSEKAEILAE